MGHSKAVRWVGSGLLVLLLLLWQCRDRSETEPANSPPAIRADTGKPGGSLAVPILTAVQLQEVLPDTFPGAEGAPPVIGRSQGQRYEQLIVHREFYFRNKGYLSITITDYGDRSEFLAVYPHFFEQAAQVDPKTWRLTRQEGELQRLLVWTHDRFAVEIEGKKVPLFIPELWKVYESIARNLDTVMRTIGGTTP